MLAANITQSVVVQSQHLPCRLISQSISVVTVCVCVCLEARQLLWLLRLYIAEDKAKTDGVTETCMTDLHAHVHQTTNKVTIRTTITGDSLLNRRVNIKTNYFFSKFVTTAKENQFECQEGEMRGASFIMIS
jgi:hypothetical protein